MDQTIAAILAETRQQLNDLLGEQLDAVYLYGSRARDDFQPDSDIDILIVLKDEPDVPAMIRLTSDVISRLSLQYDCVISRAFVSRETLLRSQQPFIRNIRNEGVKVEA